MDASLIEELITKNKPFKIETASGRLFEVPHRDFVSFSTRKTSLIVSYEENGTEHFAIVPLLTITSAMAPASDLSRERSPRRVRPAANRNARIEVRDSDVEVQTAWIAASEREPGDFQRRQKL